MYVRVRWGDLQHVSVADAWRPVVNIDSMAIGALQEIAQRPRTDLQGRLPAPAPILDTLAHAWSRYENGLMPFLIVAARPRWSGDLDVVLNPGFYELVPEDARWLWYQDMADRWRVILATGAAEWPDPERFQPGLRILRLHPTDPTVIEVVADLRDHRDRMNY